MTRTLSTIVKPARQTVVIASKPLKSVVQVADVGNAGAAGATGPAGPAGPVGPAGASGGSYIHHQSSALATWTVTHNLGYYPGGISVIDSAETVVIGDITHINISTFTVSFSTAFSGKVYVS